MRTLILLHPRGIIEAGFQGILQAVFGREHHRGMRPTRAERGRALLIRQRMALTETGGQLGHEELLPMPGSPSSMVSLPSAIYGHHNQVTGLRVTVSILTTAGVPVRPGGSAGCAGCAGVPAESPGHQSRGCAAHRVEMSRASARCAWSPSGEPLVKEDIQAQAVGMGEVNDRGREQGIAQATQARQHARVPELVIVGAELVGLDEIGSCSLKNWSSWSGGAQAVPRGRLQRRSRWGRQAGANWPLFHSDEKLLYNSHWDATGAGGVWSSITHSLCSGTVATGGVSAAVGWGANLRHGGGPNSLSSSFSSYIPIK